MGHTFSSVSKNGISVILYSNRLRLCERGVFMKRWQFLISVFCLGFITACSAGTPNQTEETFDAAAFIEEITPNVECLNSCEIELFGADVDFDDEYWAAYTSEEAYADLLGEVAILYKPEQETELSGYYLDPAVVSYYPVKNFKSNAEVEAYLKQYLSDQVIADKFHQDFLEYEGTLYLRRGAKGYGAVTCDIDSLSFVETKEDYYYVNMDYLLFDEYDSTVMLEFQKIDGAWILTDIIEETL